MTCEQKGFMPLEDFMSEYGNSFEILRQNKTALCCSMQIQEGESLTTKERKAKVGLFMLLKATEQSRAILRCVM